MSTTLAPPTATTSTPVFRIAIFRATLSDAQRRLDSAMITLKRAHAVMDPHMIEVALADLEICKQSLEATATEAWKA